MKNDQIKVQFVEGISPYWGGCLSRRSLLVWKRTRDECQTLKEKRTCQIRNSSKLMDGELTCLLDGCRPRKRPLSTVDHGTACGNYWSEYRLLDLYREGNSISSSRGIDSGWIRPRSDELCRSLATKPVLNASCSRISAVCGRTVP